MACWQLMVGLDNILVIGMAVIDVRKIRMLLWVLVLDGVKLCMYHSSVQYSYTMMKMI